MHDIYLSIDFVCRPKMTPHSHQHVQVTQQGHFLRLLTRFLPRLSFIGSGPYFYFFHEFSQSLLASPSPASQLRIRLLDHIHFLRQQQKSRDYPLPPLLPIELRRLKRNLLDPQSIFND